MIELSQDTGNIYETVCIISKRANSVGLTFFDRVGRFLIPGFEYEHFELFLVFGVRVVFYGVAGYNHGAFIVVAHIVAEVVVELRVL